MRTHVVGVDPGLVHTGLVRLLFDHDTHELWVEDQAVLGIKPDLALDWIQMEPSKAQVFIEGYRPRSNLATDQRMVEGVAAYRTGLKGHVLLNTGVKKVVRRSLMELLGCWSFTTPTHHQDLRSAARIAILGMLKDDTLNALLTTVVVDSMDGSPWTVNN
jgi:hypothetical protein